MMSRLSMARSLLGFVLGVFVSGVAVAQVSQDQCVEAGTYCAKKSALGVCVHKKPALCCFKGERIKGSGDGIETFRGNFVGVPETTDCAAVSPMDLSGQSNSPRSKTDKNKKNKSGKDVVGFNKENGNIDETAKPMEGINAL